MWTGNAPVSFVSLPAIDAPVYARDEHVTSDSCGCDADVWHLGENRENEASKNTGDLPGTEAKAGCRLESYSGVEIAGRDVGDPHSKLRSLQSP